MSSRQLKTTQKIILTLTDSTIGLKLHSKNNCLPNMYFGCLCPSKLLYSKTFFVYLRLRPVLGKSTAIVFSSLLSIRLLIQIYNQPWSWFSWSREWPSRLMTDVPTKYTTRSRFMIKRIIPKGAQKFYLVYTCSD